MSFGDYLFGVVGLAAVAIPMALAAVRLRRRLLPGWEGAPARLAESVLGVALLTVLLQLLGAFGILVPAVLIVASLAVGLGIYFGVTGAFFADTANKAPTGGPVAPPAPAIPLPQMVLALLAAAFVAAHWATGLQDVWGRGMLTFDTLWYHGPFAARIADTGSVWGMHFTDPLYLNWFYPENSELLHAAGIVLFNRDSSVRWSTSAGWAWRCWPPGASAARTASRRSRWPEWRSRWTPARWSRARPERRRRTPSPSRCCWPRRRS